MVSDVSQPSTLPVLKGAHSAERCYKSSGDPGPSCERALAKEQNRAESFCLFQDISSKKDEQAQASFRKTPSKHLIKFRRRRLGLELRLDLFCAVAHGIGRKTLRHCRLTIQLLFALGMLRHYWILLVPLRGTGGSCRGRKAQGLGLGSSRKHCATKAPEDPPQSEGHPLRFAKEACSGARLARTTLTQLAVNRGDNNHRKYQQQE